MPFFAFSKTPVVTEWNFYHFWTFVDFEKGVIRTIFNFMKGVKKLKLTILNPTDALLQSMMIAEMNNWKTLIYASFIVV